MKFSLLRAGLLASLILLSLPHNEAAAETSSSSKCGQYGEIKSNQNPSYQHINCLLTNAAIEANIPPEVVKAVATQESSWRQFDAKGQPVIAQDGGIGIMQITNQSKYDSQKLKYDITYNIKAGVEILSDMYKRKDLPKIKGAGREVIENWYFSIMAYNGTKPINSPLYKATGKRNLNAYQEKVMATLEQYSFFNDTKYNNAKLAQFPFQVADFQYDPSIPKNIEFKKKEYILKDTVHPSIYYLKKDERVFVTEDNVNVRSKPTSSSSGTQLPKNTNLIIQGNFTYDESADSKNQFVWYPVKTADQKLVGYISSAYIIKKAAPLAPKVNSITDKDTVITGTAAPNVTILVKSGSTVIGTGKTNAQGTFSIAIPVQKAGTKIGVSVKDSAGTNSPNTTVSVQDKTPPVTPTVTKLTNKDTIITGKTEANATVAVTIKGKTYSGKADATGNYKVTIPVQNADTSISVTAKDSAGNVSAARTIKVTKAAPNMPTVNTVKSTSITVIGKTEKDAIVTVKIGTKTYTAKANAAGDYKVSIPKQKAGTKLYVNAQDGKGQVSADRVVIVLQ